VETLSKIGQIDEAKLVLSKIEPPSILDYDSSQFRWFKSPVKLRDERRKIADWHDILEKEK
jgi:hypothetical protein